MGSIGDQDGEWHCVGLGLTVLNGIQENSDQVVDEAVGPSRYRRWNRDGEASTLLERHVIVQDGRDWCDGLVWVSGLVDSPVEYRDTPGWRARTPSERETQGQEGDPCQDNDGLGRRLGLVGYPPVSI